MAHVFEAEPKAPEELLAINNVVLQPHQGSATHDTREAVTGPRRTASFDPPPRVG